MYTLVHSSRTFRMSGSKSLGLGYDESVFRGFTPDIQLSETSEEYVLACLLK
jgi:hypothetical protein